MRCNVTKYFVILFLCFFSLNTEARDCWAADKAAGNLLDALKVFHTYPFTVAIQEEDTESVEVRIAYINNYAYKSFEKYKDYYCYDRQPSSFYHLDRSEKNIKLLGATNLDQAHEVYLEKVKEVFDAINAKKTARENKVINDVKIKAISKATNKKINVPTICNKPSLTLADANECEAQITKRIKIKKVVSEAKSRLKSENLPLIPICTTQLDLLTLDTANTCTQQANTQIKIKHILEESSALLVNKELQKPASCTVSNHTMETATLCLIDTKLEQESFIIKNHLAKSAHIVELNSLDTPSICKEKNQTVGSSKKCYQSTITLKNILDAEIAEAKRLAQEKKEKQQKLRINIAMSILFGVLVLLIIYTIAKYRHKIKSTITSTINRRVEKLRKINEGINDWTEHSSERYSYSEGTEEPERSNKNLSGNDAGKNHSEPISNPDSPFKKITWYENKWFWIAVAVSLIIIVGDKIRFQGDNWKSPEFQLSKRISSYGIRGCGEYYWKRISSSSVEIKCTRDGRSWFHHEISYRK